MKVLLLDLKAQYETIKEEVLSVTEQIYESQYFILGPHVQALEEQIAGYCQTAHAVGVSSGSDALLLSLMAADIKPGDRVLTTTYSFFATAGCIARLGAIPVFVDIDADTFNIDPDRMADVIEKMSKEERSFVKAVIPVHLYGQCAEMEPILEIAAEHDLAVIEDAAQAIGSEYKGQRAGSMGLCGCFSFFPSKNLGAFGDGGIITTDSDEFYEKLKILRGHGSHPKYYHKLVGGNFRLDALQAAIVSVKLKHLDTWTEKRQKNAALYGNLFAREGLTDFVRLPLEIQNRHIYNQFVILAPGQRDALRRFLGEAGIGTEVYYPVPMHLQECFAFLNCKKGDFPVAENAALNSMALPIYPELTDAQMAYVVEKTKEFKILK
ncbi:MAG: DegT/DnrJ/EryC1/StrS family aminotransferase [Deltaproteobacteria bacterium]|nr:DegT/DnrJ/EryC1/StrS family aminotransferase [Deltaproteobacteria bacterium]